MEKEIQIKAFWDSEAEVWVAQSSDVPGLVTEAETMEQLISKLQTMIPELLQANGMLDHENITEIPFHKNFNLHAISFISSKSACVFQKQNLAPLCS